MIGSMLTMTDCICGRTLTTTARVTRSIQVKQRKEAQSQTQLTQTLSFLLCLSSDDVIIIIIILIMAAPRAVAAAVDTRSTRFSSPSVSARQCCRAAIFSSRIQSSHSTTRSCGDRAKKSCEGNRVGSCRVALGAFGLYRGTSGSSITATLNPARDHTGSSSFGARRRARVRRRRGGGGAARACWSLEVSVATSAFVAGTLATLLHRGDRRSRGHALFLGVFGSMQVVDTILWWNEIHGAGGGGGLAACDLTNRMATRVGLCIICLEPMAAMLGTHLIAVSCFFFSLFLYEVFSLSFSNHHHARKLFFSPRPRPPSPPLCSLFSLTKYSD